MPNWCQGVLKIRGPKENHVKFIKEGLLGLRCDDVTRNTVKTPVELLSTLITAMKLPHCFTKTKTTRAIIFLSYRLSRHGV